MSNTKDTNGPAFPVIAGQTVYSTGTSARAYAAINLKVPDSGEEWLDDMIRQGLRDEFAAKAMQAFINSGNEDDESVAEWSYKMADSMLKAREQ